MFLTFRVIVLALAGLLVAVTAGVFAFPYDAAAPPEKPPAIIENAGSNPPQAEPLEDTPPIVEKSEDTPAAPPQSESGELKVKETLETITKTLTEPVPSAQPSLNTINNTVREATVNILCNSQAGGPLSSITGSGVFIDPTGVILTNAHVAQYFLLKNYSSPGFLNCIIRTGSPASPAYTAELLFLPPSWIAANAKKITDDAPTGNGERDYALVRVTGMIDSRKELPAAFPFLPLFFSEITEGDTVVVAGYPAGFSGGITIAKDLYAASSITQIGNVYTYASTTIDIYSVGGSVVAQQGSSGGAVADSNGNLVGLIVTSTITPDTASRDLHALATSYIARDFEHEYGISLPSFFTRDLKGAAQIFATVIAPTLTQALTAVLNQ